MTAHPYPQPRSGVLPRAPSESWVRALAIAGLTLSSFSLSVWLSAPQGPPFDPAEQGSTVSHVLWGAIYAAVTLTLLARLRDLLETPPEGTLLWLLAALPLASAAWSLSPRITAWQGTGVLLSTLFALLIARWLTTGELVAALSWILLAIGIASAAVALFLPQRGLDHLRGDAWSGIFTTKNELGRVMALAVAAWTVRLVGNAARRSVCLGAIAFAAAVVILSHSRTGFVAACATGALVPLLAALRTRAALRGLSAGLLAVAGAGALVWIGSANPRFLASGDLQDTLTGRTKIWSACWHMIHDHFWLGYGFGAFWRGVDGPSAHLWSIVNGNPAHAHNGVLETWIDLGLLGVLLFGAVFVVAARRALDALHAGSNVEALWPAAFLVFFLLYNTTESTALSPQSLYWILFGALILRPGYGIGKMAGDAPQSRFPIAGRPREAR